MTMDKPERRASLRRVYRAGSRGRVDQGRTAEEHGIRLRSVSDAVLGQAASLLAGEGSVYHVGANLVEGPEALTLVTLGRRWPAQIEPGWTAPVLALSGLDAISMRVRPLSRA
jgi:hypothetical protein